MTLDRIEWDHPRLGRISEVACDDDRAAILTALRTLGIGCTGRPADPGSRCLRCQHPGVAPRELLRALRQP